MLDTDMAQVRASATAVKFWRGPEFEGEGCIDINRVLPS